MGILKQKVSSFYALKGVSLVIEFDEVRGVGLIGIFPSIVTFRVSFPFDEVLELSRSSMTSVAFD